MGNTIISNPNYSLMTTFNAQEHLGFPILTTQGLFNMDNSTMVDVTKDRQSIFFISPTINHLYREQIDCYIRNRFGQNQGIIKIVPSGEQNKNFDNVLNICKLAKEASINRKGLFVGIGGGTLLDTVGFAASIYRRGIEYIKVGTTLVAQIDASIGIKTGINFQENKNLLGTFYPPFTVISDTNFLYTLPIQEMRCGLAEIIKIAIVADPFLFELVAMNYESFLNKHLSENKVQKIINLSITDMISELSTNAYEHCLQRKVDFGHTFSPAIEKMSKYRIPHGEAVSIDMCLSCYISYRLGHLSSYLLQTILNLVKNIGLSYCLDDSIDPLELFESLNQISLHRGNSINMPIPTDIGHTRFITDMSEISLNMFLEGLSFLRTYSIDSVQCVKGE
jgi:3-dehydroquinate synthetase